MPSFRTVTRSPTVVGLLLAAAGIAWCSPALAEQALPTRPDAPSSPAIVKSTETAGATAPRAPSSTIGTSVGTEGSQQSAGQSKSDGHAGSNRADASDAGGAKAGAAADAADARTDDRKAFFAARLAALHAGLTVNADQEALWAPVETAIRDLEKGRHPGQTREGIARLLQQSPSDLLRLRGEQLSQRGDAMRKLAEASAPLLASLDDGQKNRLPVLLVGMRPRGILRAAFDIRYGRVVDDPDEASDSSDAQQYGEEGSSSHRGSDANGSEGSSRRAFAPRHDGAYPGRGDDRQQSGGSDDRRRDTLQYQRTRPDMEDEDRS